MESQIDRDILRQFGRKKTPKFPNSFLPPLNKGKNRADPALPPQNDLQLDEFPYPNPQIFKQFVEALAANRDPHTVCSSSTEQLWLASFVSILELGASGLETRQFRDIASRLRLWGLSVGDMFDEGALPPTLNKLVQGILADIAVTLTHLLKEHSRVMNRGDCRRNQLVILLGRDEFAGTALDEPGYLEVGCSEGVPFSEFVALCRDDLEGLTESLFDLLPTVCRSTLTVRTPNRAGASASGKVV